MEEERKKPAGKEAEPHQADTFRFETLGNEIYVAVSSSHRFGTDAFLLADFAAPRHKDRTCDLGTGCGVIPLYWMKQYRPAECVGVEIQPEAVKQFQAGIARSLLEDSVQAVCADLKEYAAETPGTFDVVTCNPPYKKAGAGILSESAADQLARHETACDINDVCAAAARLLRFGGRACFCQRPERLADVLCAMRENDLEPKRLRMVAKDAASRPWLFLVEGKKGSRPFLQVESPLLLAEGGVCFGTKTER